MWETIIGSFIGVLAGWALSGVVVWWKDRHFKAVIKKYKCIILKFIKIYFASTYNEVKYQEAKLFLLNIDTLSRSVLVNFFERKKNFIFYFYKQEKNSLDKIEFLMVQNIYQNEDAKRLLKEIYKQTKQGIYDESIRTFIKSI